VLAAVAVTLSGLAALGGIQIANALTTTSPTLGCTQVSPDPTPSVTGAGGSTWDSGSGPGSTGIYLGANAGSLTKLSAAANAGATSIEVDALAVYGQTMTITGAIGTYTDTSPSANWASVAPETITISPSLSLVSGTTLRLNTAVTLNPTTTTPNRSVSDGITSGTDLQSATADFTSADIGQPVTGATSAGSTTGLIPPGTTITQVNSTTDVTLSAAATTNTSGVDITIGYIEEASASVVTRYDYQATYCRGSFTGSGVYAPTTAILTGHDAGVQNGVLALAQNPSNLTLAVTYPTIGAGWVDNGGTGVLTQPATNETFTSATKEKYAEVDGMYFDAASWSWTSGVATSDFPTTAGTFNIEYNGGIACTAAELQAINAGTGPDSGTIPEGGSELVYCDGGTASASGSEIDAEVAALNEYALLPGVAYGSDGTPYVAFWSIDGTADNVLF
jgi:hypothetical protein